MSRLKQALTSASKGLTITLPASYWYLQHFDLVNLVRNGPKFTLEMHSFDHVYIGKIGRLVQHHVLRSPRYLGQGK
jgi:hypothetical protein